MNLDTFSQKQFKQTIRGDVKNAETEQVIFGASVVLQNSNPLIGTNSSLKGTFSLQKLKLGTYSIKISSLGYETIVLDNINLTSAKEIFLEVRLQEKINTINTVEIVATRNNEKINEMATVSITSISSVENNHFSGGLSDPQRVVLSYAGIKNQGDLNNGISIRGNKPTNMLWQLEGIEIQDPNHFTLGGSFGRGYINGAVSSISGNLLKNINLYTGAFPAEYGNAISGVMDLTLRDGNNNNFEYNFNIGMLGLEASAEGPIIRGGSFLVSFRYSTMNLLNDMGFDIGDSEIGYKDVNYKISLPTKKFGKFSLFGMAGWSTSKDIEAFDKNNRQWNTTYNNSVFGFSHKIAFSKKSYFKTVFALSNVDNYYYDYGYTSPYYVFNKVVYEKKIQTFRTAIKMYNKLNSKNSIVSGFKINKPVLQFKNGSETKLNLNDTIHFYGINLKKTAIYLQFFSQWKYKFNKKLSINSGFHFLLFKYNKKYSIEPRFSLKWSINKKHTVNFGTGLHSKVEFLPIYMADVVKLSNPLSSYSVYGEFNKELELTKSFHLSANYIFKPYKFFSIKVEPYLQYHFHVPQTTLEYYDSEDTLYYSFSTLNTSLDRYDYLLDNKGAGLNYGLELTANKHFSKNYYFLIASSLYRAFYKTPITKTWQPTIHDGLFTFSASVGKDFKLGKFKQSTLSLNTRFLWSGGYLKQDINSLGKLIRYKNYYKLDTRIAYTLNKKKFTYTVALDLLNTTNHKNDSPEYLKQASGILPVLSFNFRFQK